jgi:hypothetical protein
VLVWTVIFGVTALRAPELEESRGWLGEKPSHPGSLVGSQAEAAGVGAWCG